MMPLGLLMVAMPGEQDVKWFPSKQLRRSIPGCKLMGQGEDIRA